MGYPPVGENGTWEQPFDGVALTAKAPETWSFTGKKGSADLEGYQDYRSDPFSFAKIGVPAFYFDTGTDYIGNP